MKSLKSLFILLMICNISFSQEIDETLDKKTRKKYEKKEKKRQREEELKENKARINTLLETQQYVLEADQLSGRSGATVQVSSTLNFFAVDSSEAVIQVGSVRGFGYNGVGGITDEANISRYEISETKAGYSVRIFAGGSLTSYTIFLSVNAGGNATARVTGLSGGVINFHGRLVPLSETRVYKGQTTY